MPTPRHMPFKPKQVRLACAPIAWINDDIADFAGHYTLEQCLKETAEAGYAGTETGRQFPTDPVKLKAKLDKHNLVMASGWWSGRLRTGTVAAEKERIEDYLKLFAGCGTEILFYGEIDGSIQGEENVPLSERPTLSEREFKAYGERLSELARYTRRRGVRLCFHHHMGTVIQTTEDIDRLMAATGQELGLLVDTGHLAFAGGRPQQALRRHAARVAYIHLKDLREHQVGMCHEEDWSFIKAIREGVFTVPGDGHLNFAEVVRELANIRYSGWLVVEAEQDPSEHNPLQMAIDGREYMEALLDECRFVILDEVQKKG